MKGVKVPLQARQGKTFERSFRFMDKNKNIIKLTGFKGRMHVRSDIDDEDTVIELTTENGRIEIDGELGKVVLKISAEDMEAIEADNYIYDLELISPDGRVYGPVIPSAFKVTPEVTR